ncbi:hypothetical protein CCMSSC00406_0003038 [Pleurotus cornucopiae]|uniref:Uncharacterized protein n=1 Tax=Pleurotus cornucopiae TaxID=5321 RepID=A0ACB7J5J7_PLECO|nr:hypothetical protein CCMSSC00406_0003038 [Pleurotus cornucopiae]
MMGAFSQIPPSEPVASGPDSETLQTLNRKDGCAFYNVCSIYFQLCPDHFPTEQAKILGCLSFFQKDQAKEYTDMVLWSLKDLYFKSWAAFATEFQTRFLLDQEHKAAMLKLESTQQPTPESLGLLQVYFPHLGLSSCLCNPVSNLCLLQRLSHTVFQWTLTTPTPGPPLCSSATDATNPVTCPERMSAIEDLLTAADVVESTGTPEGIDAEGTAPVEESDTADFVRTNK